MADSLAREYHVCIELNELWYCTLCPTKHVIQWSEECQNAFLLINKSHFEINNTQMYENCSLGAKIYYEISIFFNFRVIHTLEISIIEIQYMEKNVGTLVSLWDKW